MTGTRTRFRHWTWARRATAMAFLALIILGGREWFPWFTGSTPASTLLDVVPLADPLAALEVLLATGAIESTLLIGAGLLVTASLLLGPVFCGWACPLGFLLDLNDGIRLRLKRFLEGIKVSMPALDSPREMRYMALGVALGFSAAAGLPAFQTVSPIHLVSRLFVFYPEPALSGDHAFMEKLAMIARITIAAGGVLLLVLVLIFIIEYAAPRIFCRALCPLGAMYSVLGRFAPLRVRVKDNPGCPAGCRQCTTYCPMGIRVKEDFTTAGKQVITRMECTRCGACIDQCPGGVLELGFGRKAHGPSPASKKG
jgi:ferredoxin-type protein NapH